MVCVCDGVCAMVCVCVMVLAVRSDAALQILDALLQHKFAAVFAHPVNPALDGVPDYFQRIRHPMDLDTVRVSLGPSTLRHDAMRHDAMRCDAIRCNVIRCDAIRCDTIPCNTIRCCAMRCNDST